MFSVPTHFAGIFMILFVAFNFYQSIWNKPDMSVLHSTGITILTVILLFVAGILCDELIKNTIAGL